MNENETIEKRVADVVLERETESITLDGTTYRIAPPTLATLIMTSELISTMPDINPDSENPLEEVLGNARHCRQLGKIAAVLILGAKRVSENRQVPVHQHKRGVLTRLFRRRHNRTIAEVDRFAEIILHEVRPSVLQQILMRRLVDMEIGDFFGLTTSLSAANHLKPTREVEKATASGE